MSHAVTLRTVPALAGWQWISRGWQLLKANPIHIHMAFFFFLGALGFVSFIPMIGSVIASMLMPALYLGVMATIAQAEKTSSKQLGSLLDALGSPFKRDTSGGHQGQRTTFKRLAMLGLVYTAAVFVMFSVYYLFDGGTAFGAMLKGEAAAKAPLDAAQASAAQMQLAVSLIGLLLCYIPVSLAFWFTQQLVGWHGQSISKAVFFSWLGCWRNKTAFAVYALAWVVIFITAAFVMTTLSSLLGIASLVTIMIIPITLFMMVWVFCSFYASYESLVQVLE
jgi:hypothetical protein